MCRIPQNSKMHLCTITLYQKHQHFNNCDRHMDIIRHCTRYHFIHEQKVVQGQKSAVSISCQISGQHISRKVNKGNNLNEVLDKIRAAQSARIQQEANIGKNLNEVLIRTGGQRNLPGFTRGQHRQEPPRGSDQDWRAAQSARIHKRPT